jgi:hypothetical protein
MTASAHQPESEGVVMNEPEMIEAMQAALAGLGVDDRIEAVGQFAPRGHTGAMFAGGLVGDSLTGPLGGLGDSIGTVGGAIAGARLHDASSGLPDNMLVGASASHVYGFAATGRRALQGLVFRVARETLTVTVRERINVRVVELADGATGATIELEGNRLPVTHSKDVIDVLRP